MPTAPERLSLSVEKVTFGYDERPVLVSTGTTAFSDRSPEALSGGERQRVVIAMVLAQEPGIILLDEPTQHLDLTRQGDVLDLAVSLSRERGLTIVATMHDLNLAA